MQVWSVTERQTSLSDSTIRHLVCVRAHGVPPYAAAEALLRPTSMGTATPVQSQGHKDDSVVDAGDDDPAGFAYTAGSDADYGVGMEAGKQRGRQGGRQGGSEA
eukprot:GHVU01089368.1.p7 GENE.GHVU01089368.1~~GHVU01089368.1.p7  ORF type:complete len:104 (+),score=15.74 GHVU01089368.1:400-711(+)